MALFLVLTWVEGKLVHAGDAGVASRYPLVYSLKIGVIALSVWLSRSAWKDLRPWPGRGGLLLSVALGLAVAAIWVGLDGHYPALPVGGKREGFDPRVLAFPARAYFLAVRLFALTLLVPLLEELFWRSLVMRWIINQEFRRVPIGRVTPLAAAVTSALFALEHPE
jgi:CAAX prenyl protease-like protein